MSYTKLYMTCMSTREIMHFIPPGTVRGRAVSLPGPGAYREMKYDCIGRKLASILYNMHALCGGTGMGVSGTNFHVRVQYQMFLRSSIYASTQCRILREHVTYSPFLFSNTIYGERGRFQQLLCSLPGSKIAI